MYQIKKEAFGYKLTFGDVVNTEEMSAWVEESRTAVASAPTEFGVFVDMRTLKPLGPEAQTKMQEGQKLFKEKGMQRSVVVLQSALTTMQFKKIAQETGIYQWERYIDASSQPDWESVGVAWVKDGTDPDA